jgi:hypothetical protein
MPDSYAALPSFPQFKTAIRFLHRATGMVLSDAAH